MLFMNHIPIFDLIKDSKIELQQTKKKASVEACLIQFKIWTVLVLLCVFGFYWDI